MFGIPTRFTAGVVGAFLLAFAAEGARAEEQPTFPELHYGDPFRGGTIYRDRCIECHGRDGSGAVEGTPDLNEKVRINDARLLNHVLAGFRPPGEIHPEATHDDVGLHDDLTVKDLRDVLAFLHNYFHYKTFARTGEHIYHQTCVACHGADGKGTVPGAPDFTKEAGTLVQSYETLLKHMLNGFQSPGSPMAMPPKGGQEALTVEDLRQVLAYLHQRFHWRTYHD